MYLISQHYFRKKESLISQDSSNDFKTIATYPQVTNFQNRPMKNNIKTWGGGGGEESRFLETLRRSLRTI